MRTERHRGPLPLAARRTFRFGFVVALALAIAYGFGMQLPFFAPIFAAILTAAPKPPPGVKGLVGLLAVASVTVGTGLLLIPVVLAYPVTAVLLIAAGLYFATFAAVGRSKALVGTLLTVGLTLIPAAGLIDSVVAFAVVQALLVGIGVATVCQWLVYPFFPEDPPQAAKAPAASPDTVRAGWIALRATLVVLPPVMLAFTNPALYMPLIMKSVMLGQQSSMLSARAAGRELIGSTLLAGLFAIAFWLALKIWPSLWMFSLWMLAFATFVAGKLYGAIPSRFSPSFWTNMTVTMLILLGPAVQDSLGRDPYDAFAVRFTLFLAVTAYAWYAVLALEWLRGRGGLRPARLIPDGA